jgi:FHS family Na+ dependent glucose MFS transporter 1
MLNILRKPASHNAWLYHTLVYYLTFIALGASSAIIGTTIQDLADNVNQSKSDISFILGASGFGYFLGSYLTGYLFDRLRPYSYLLICILIVPLVMFFIPLVGWSALFVPLFLLLGMSQSGMDVGSNTLIVWVHSNAVDPFMNGLHFFWAFGAFLSPLLVNQLTLAGGVEWAYWGVGALMVIPLTWLLILRWNNVADPVSPQHGKSQAETEAEVNHTLVYAIAFFFFLYVGIEASFLNWIYSYTTDTGLGDRQTASYVTAAFWGTFALGRLLGVPLATRFSPNQILFADLFICLAGIGVILASHTQTALWIGTIIFGFGNASIFATMLTFAKRRMTITSWVTSRFFLGLSAAGTLIPWFIGQGFEQFGEQLLMWSILVMTLGCIALLVGLIAYAPYQETSSSQ